MTDATSTALPPDDAYALIAPEAKSTTAPTLNYQPPMPRDRSIGIGLIGAGGISASHLDAYRRYGFNVVAICDRHLDRATARRDAFFPEATVTANPGDLIGNPAARVLDITVHTDSREPLIRAALEAGQH